MSVSGSRRIDRAIGIALGILLGIAIVIAFVFLGSQQTIDAPSIDQNGTAAERAAEPARDR